MAYWRVGGMLEKRADAYKKIRGGVISKVKKKHKISCYYVDDEAQPSL